MLLEVCVDTIEGAIAAVKGGAGRIELCSALSEGGLTPSLGLMKAASALPVPVYAMIRPRGGLFSYSAEEQTVMLDDIDAARSAGLSGVVIGAQDELGRLDVEALDTMLRRAQGMGSTLHRVIDVVPEPLDALSTAIELGFDRVLTSGGQPFADQGAELIADMVMFAHGRIGVMPGCGLTPENVAGVIRATGVTEVHAACALPIDGDPAFSDFDPPGGRMRTSETEVLRLVEAIASSSSSA